MLYTRLRVNFPPPCGGYESGGYYFVNSVFLCRTCGGNGGGSRFPCPASEVRRLQGAFSKATASFFFLLTALCAAAANPGHGVYAVLIVFGLALGLSGDIWLDLKWIYKADADKFLNAGFIAFMIGHLFYIGAVFASCGKWTALSVLLPVTASVIVSLGNIIISEKLMKLKFGKFRAIVGAYTFLLFMTFAVSFSAMILNSFAKQWILMSAGGLLFAFSDAVLSTMYFKEGGNTKANIIINHVSYYAAQFIIASSVLFIK